MRFHFGHLQSDGKLSSGELSLGITDDPFPNIEVGNPNKDGKYFRLWIGQKLYSKLPKTDVLCPRDGDVTLGKCVNCGIDVTPDKVKKVPAGKQMIGGVMIDLVNPFVEHLPVKKPFTIAYGSIKFTREKDTLLIIEEKAVDRKGQIGMLFRADGGARGGATIELETKEKNPEHEKINARAQGESWISKKDRRAGWTAMRFMILKPGDRIKVTRTGDLKGGPEVALIGVMPDFTLKAITMEEMEVTAPAAKEEEVAAQGRGGSEEEGISPT